MDNSDVMRMLREAAILFAITLISGVLLGFVYELTKEPIRVQQEKAIQEACMAVLPGAEAAGVSFRPMEYTVAESLSGELAANGVTIGTVYEAVAVDGTLYGYVTESTSSQGYGGNIVLYTGVDLTGKVGGVSILTLTETAGLGMEAPNVLVPQFAGKQVEKFKYTKSGSQSEDQVDAISGATITTKAVVNAVNGGLAVAQDLLQGGGQNE
ncbi:MAG: RnfABCDGE type electron transport complex subunit G [Lachnospiraceae bacterium]|nr:RnfABCDGE type electron transport complex subunit G [Lachnospiraceae bacterium]